MDLRLFWKAIGRIAFSLLWACIFYAGRMAVFILTARLDSPVVDTLPWLLAPVIIAAGFAAGIAIMEHKAAVPHRATAWN